MLEIAVEKRLGEFIINANIACQVTGIVALFGRSGAGKTSLINMLAGLLRPDRGRIAVNGETLFESAAGIDVAPEKRRLGYVFQEGRLFPHLSVRANLLYGYRHVPPGERQVHEEQVVGLLGLEPLLARRPRDLSGGEKQRVALGRALLANPRLLLMDEPLASLDQERKEEVLPFIERLRDELAIPIVYVTHAMAEIVRLADTLVLLTDGRVAAVGSLDELTSRLDLRPLTGRYDAGAVLSATVVGQDAAYGLTALDFGGERLLVPQLDLPPGSDLHLRIRARDVALARKPPEESSILNVLPCRVTDIGSEPGPQVDLRLEARGGALWARITRRSLAELGLRVGDPVYALVKAVAIDRASLGRGVGGGRFLPERPLRD
ncbi:MAG TPA: molybdenum ABC transporter ATP-binding protein [Kiloniellales bacterium]|nr:molybdenum ABC transporter ATP-binding protein [Kiloniellales bacterium]